MEEAGEQERELSPIRHGGWGGERKQTHVQDEIQF